MSKVPKADKATVAVPATVAPERQAASEGHGEFVLYTTDDGLTRVEMRAESGSLWLSQAEIGTLFQTRPQNVTHHVKVIYAEGKADPEATCKSDLQVRRAVCLYGLEILADDAPGPAALERVATRLEKKEERHAA